MKTFFLAFLILFCGNVCMSNDITAIKNRYRAGLPNFFSKLRAGETVNIAYLGGSITEAKNGWRDQSMKWLQEVYPKTVITQINAGIGGTGSDLGVFRLKKDVLVHKPDLIFVEFAVNDNNLAPQIIRQTMEGIVRQIWRADKQIDICFVYTLTGTTAETLVEGKVTKAIQAMDDIAEHYKIPSIHLGIEVLQLFKEKKLVFRGLPEEFPDKIVFSKDNTHPYEQTGHKLYTDVLKKALKEMASLKREPFKRDLAPYEVDNWEDAQMITLEEVTKEGKWEVVAPNDKKINNFFLKKFPFLLRGTKANSSAITFDFEGSLVGLYDIVGPGCGQIAIYIDNKLVTTKARFDKYSTYYRPQYFYLPGIKKGKHRAKFLLSELLLDKASILKEGGRTIENHHQYDDNFCYLGYLLIRGNEMH